MRLPGETVSPGPLALAMISLAIVSSLLPSPANSLVIYRRKPKPKLICHEEETGGGHANDSTTTSINGEPMSMMLRGEGGGGVEFFEAEAHVKQRHPISARRSKRKDEALPDSLSADPRSGEQWRGGPARRAVSWGCF